MTINEDIKMNEPVLVSVIVPVYNAGPYLKDCIDSLRKQTWKNIEVLLMDDGSTDQSGLICDDIARKDNRFKVHHNSNHGVSYTRNLAINLARGKYLVFVDSDDSVEPSYVEDLLYPVENHYDMSICGLKEVFVDTGKVKVREKKGELTGFLRQDLYHLMPFLRIPVCKIYKMSIINRYHLRFAEDISYGEDQLFNYMYYYHINNYCFIDKSLYIYKRHSDSLTDWTKLRNIKQVRSAIKRLSYERKFMDRCNPYKKEIVMNDDVMTAISNFCDLKSYKTFKKQVKALCRYRYKNARMDRLKRVVFGMLLDKEWYFIVFLYCRLFKYH